MTDLRCHFDSDGWLQGPIRITHLLTPNHGTGFGTGRGVVMHTEDGFEAGTVNTFMNAANKVSAFFSIAQDGSCHQYVPVGRGLTAWSQAAGNEAWRGIEDEDGTHPSVPLTQAQITTFAQILEACSAFDGFPLQVTDDPVNGRGLILHSDGGQAWGGHFQCPGPVRAAQRPVIVALAMSIRQGAPTTGWTASMIADLPTLQQGSKDTAGHVYYVHRMQALIQIVGHIKSIPSAAAVIPDGEFDAGTASGLKAIQASWGLTQDAVCGKQTWGVLIAGSAG